MSIKSLFLHLLIVSILVFSLLSAPILAHTTLLSSEPANGSFSKQFLLPFAFSQHGLFQITWRGLGQDGHVLTGTFEFKKIKN